LVTFNVCEGCDAAQTDANVQVLTRYDQAGNLIAQRDGLHLSSNDGYALNKHQLISRKG
jgi:hypothetical protein